MLYYYIMEADPHNSETSQLRTSAQLDKFAVLLSGVCILHCLIAPIIFTLLPILSISAFWEDLVFHKLMLWLVLPTSTLALLIGCRKHRGWAILGTGFVGMAVLVFVAFAGHDILSSLHEKVLTSAGGIILAISHVMNYRACQSIRCNDRNCSSAHHH